MERPYICALADKRRDVYDNVGEQHYNLVGVLMTHAAEDREKNLKPPTINQDNPIKHYTDPATKKFPKISRITHFTVHLESKVAWLGHDLKLLVGHFHDEVALGGFTGGRDSPKKQLIKAVLDMMYKWKPHLFRCDAKMALLELRALIESVYKSYPEEYKDKGCLLYTSPSPRDRTRSRMPSSA